MNNYIRNLYRLANMYTKGGPKKKNGQTNTQTTQTTQTPQFSFDYDAWRKDLDNQMYNRSYAQIDNVRTPNKVAQAETEVQAAKEQKKALEEEVYRKSHAEIKPMSQNPMDYASTNPAIQQMAETARLNALNPQTVYRPDMYYIEPYVSPETRERAQRDMRQYGALLLGAADPMFALYLLGSGANELFTDDPNAREAIEQTMAVAPWWLSTKNFFNNRVRNTAEWVLKRTEKNIEKNIGNPVGQVMQQHRHELFSKPATSSYNDWLAGSMENADKWINYTVGKNSRMPYRMTRQATTLADADRIVNRARFWNGTGRGSFQSDVFIPKNMIDNQRFWLHTGDKDGAAVFSELQNENLFSKVKRSSKSFKNSVGVTANPKDYYRVNLNELMQTRSTAFQNPELRTIIKNQTESAKNAASINAGRLDIRYNPNTIRFGTHMWPIGYGNVTTGVPTGVKARIGLNSIPAHLSYWGALGTAGVTASKWNQSNQFLHSGDYDDNDIIGVTWFNQLPPEEQQILSDVFSDYQMAPYDKQTIEKIQSIEEHYNAMDEDRDGFNAYLRHIRKGIQ